MSKYRFFIIIFFLVMSRLCSVLSDVLAQQDQPGAELLNDIKIMETILDQLISPKQEHLAFWGANTKGYYLKNYGVIFNVNYSVINREIIAIDLERRLKAREGKFMIVDKDHESDLDLKQEIEQLKSTLVRFLGSWTSSVTHLAPDEKVTIIVDLNGAIPGFIDSPEASIRQLIASVCIGEISNFRKGIISDKDFSKKISFDEVKAVDEDISILSNVIQTSLEHPDREFVYGLASDVKGIYFKGYGVIFFTDVTFGPKTITGYSKMLYNALEKAKGQYSIAVKEGSEPSEQSKKNVQQLEQKLIHLISNYGHTLKTVQPDEWLEIAINFKGFPVTDKYSKTILRVQKKNIDDFNRERIKFDQFKNMVRVSYY